jgi:mRNA interferase MazF
MGQFVKGDVVVTPFPFSDLTAKSVADSYAIPITNIDFASRGLPRDSNIRPNRLFTADANIVLYRAGVLTAKKVQEVVAKIIQIMSA